MKVKLYNSISTIIDRGLIIFFYAFINELNAFIKKKILRKKFFQKKIFNFFMFLDLYDLGIGRTLILFGKRELDHKFIIDQVLKKNMVVLDIGANIGYYALIELSIISEGFLIAVEPSPKNFQLLKQNLILNNYKNYEIHNFAISNEDKIKTFYISKYSNMNTFHRSDDKSLGLTGEKLSIKTRTINQVSNGKKIDFIRMDVEGHEVQILNSIIQYIKKENHKPIILFEPHLSRYSLNNDIKIPLNNLINLGYKISYISSSWSKGSRLIEKLNYISIKKINTDGVQRKIYQNIELKDLINLITVTGGVRSILLEANV